MNWQLIKNVNPPKAKVIELYFKEDDSVRFAERSEDGESIDIADTYRHFLFLHSSPMFAYGAGFGGCVCRGLAYRLWRALAPQKPRAR